MSYDQNKCCKSDSDYEAVETSLKTDLIELHKSNGAYGDQQQCQGPWSEMYDDDIDRRDKRSCRIETPEIEVSCTCWWGGHGYRAGDRFGAGWMSHKGYEDTVLSTRPKRRSRL
jgi:hypothetical protein